MNCEEDYFENEETERERAKAKTAVGRVSRPDSTRPLQECIGRSAMSRGSTGTDRQMVGESRIVRRRRQRPKKRGGE
jgi:hypothetical protein